MIWACGRKYFEIAQFLIYEGADPLANISILSQLVCDVGVLQTVINQTKDLPRLKELLAQKVKDGNNILMLAHEQGLDRVVSILMYIQADRLLTIVPEQNLPGKLVVPIVIKQLISQSEYFLTLLHGEFKESSKQDIVIKEDLGDILKQLLEFQFTQHLNIDHDNFRAFVALSNKYMLPSAYPKLQQWLKKHKECHHWKHHLAELKELYLTDIAKTLSELKTNR